MNTERAAFESVFEVEGDTLTLLRNVRCSGITMHQGLTLHKGQSLGMIDFTQWIGHDLELSRDDSGPVPVYAIVGIYGEAA